MLLESDIYRVSLGFLMDHDLRVGVHLFVFYIFIFYCRLESVVLLLQLLSSLLYFFKAFHRLLDSPVVWPFDQFLVRDSKTDQTALQGVRLWFCHEWYVQRVPALNADISFIIFVLFEIFNRVDLISFLLVAKVNIMLLTGGPYQRFD